ncbi:MAG: hypothetical protein IT423_18480 [Pirellulaceae bacterium]|nr:hypothetical protein [Pirellulaceae bacterium]
MSQVRLFNQMHTLSVVLWLAAAIPASAQNKPEVGERVKYEQVREVLRKRCVSCHNLDEMRGDLDLSDLNAILAGSSSGPVVIPGKPNQSLLYKSTAHLEDPVMPPNSPRLPSRELDLIRRWIESGLENVQSTTASGANSMAKASVKPPTNMPVKPPAKPAVSDPATNKLSSQSTSELVGTGLATIKSVLQATPITALDTHPTRNIAVVSGDRQAVLFSTTNGKWLGAFDFPEGDVTALRFSRDGSKLIVAGGMAGLSGRVVVFDLANGKRLVELAEENDTILALDMSPDGQWIAVGGPAKVVRIYRVADGSVVHTLRKHTDWVLSVRFSDDGLLVASGDRFGGLFVWDPIAGVEFAGLRGHVGAVHAVVWNTAGDQLFSAGEDGMVRHWDMHRKQLVDQRSVGAGAILDLAVKEELFACGGRGKKLARWISPANEVKYGKDSDQIEQLAFAADGTLVSVDAQGIIRLVQADSVETRQEFQLPSDSALRAAMLTRLKRQVSQAKETPKLLDEPISPSAAQETAGQPPAQTLVNDVGELERQLDELQTSLGRTEVVMSRIERSITITSAALAELQQSQAELRQQWLQQKELLKAAQQRAEQTKSQPNR